MGRRIDVDTSLFQGCVPAGYYNTGSQIVHSSGPPSRRAVGVPTMCASWGFRIMDVTLRVYSYIVNYKGCEVSARGKTSFKILPAKCIYIV